MSNHTDKPHQDCYMCRHRERNDDRTYSCGHPDYIDRDDIELWETRVMDSDVKQVSPGLPLPGCSAMKDIGPCPGWACAEERWQTRQTLYQRENYRVKL